MKAILVTTPRFEGLECLHCHRLAERGQVILVQTIKDVSFNVEEVVWHASCVAGIIDKAPQPTDQKSFEALRERMATSGAAFPD